MSNNKLKEFISADKIYKFLYPENWDWQVDPESKGDTLMFLDRNNAGGILRVTAMTIKGKNPDALLIIKDYKKNYEGAECFKRKNINYLTFIKEVFQNDISLIIYWWYLAKKDKLIIFSFTLTKEESKSKIAKKELSIVQDIIKSINIF